jgi:hypothetical protein
MKITTYRRAVVARMACPECHEPARARPPRMWVAANGPRPSWSHADGEPLCPVIGSGGYRPARRPCVVTALRPARPRRRSRTLPTRRAVTRRAVAHPSGAPPRGDVEVFLVAGGDMVAVFDNAEAAGIMAVTMAGANLEPVLHRMTAAKWAQSLPALRKHCPFITISDARSGRVAGAS